MKLVIAKSNLVRIKYTIQKMGCTSNNEGFEEGHIVMKKKVYMVGCKEYITEWAHWLAYSWKGRVSIFHLYRDSSRCYIVDIQW